MLFIKSNYHPIMLIYILWYYATARPGQDINGGVFDQKAEFFNFV